MTVYSGTCGENATWTVDTTTGLLHISGTGAMEDYTANTQQPWYEYNSYLSKIVIDSGITHIGGYAFSKLSGPGGQITIPSTVVSIGIHAFSNMANITEVIIGRAVDSVGPNAFNVCYGLSAIKFKGGQPATLGMNSFDTWRTTTIYSSGWASDDVFKSPDVLYPPASDSTTLLYDIYVPTTCPPVKVGGVWRESTPYVKVGGVWREVTDIYVKADGVWKEVN